MATVKFDTKADVAAILKTAPISPAIRALIAGLLSFIDDKQFSEYSAVFMEAVGALSETPRGHAVLARLGLPHETTSPDQG